MLRQSFEIPPIFALTELPRQREKTLALDIAHVIGDFFDAGDLRPWRISIVRTNSAASSKDSWVPVSNQA